MNRLYITLISLFLAPVLLYANNNQDYWFRGTVHLRSGESVGTMLQYDQQKDYVLVMQESGIKVYNASQIDSYEVFDPVSRSYRTFYPLPFPEKRRNGYQFFELLQDGELLLLCRETERWQDRFMPNHFPGSMVPQPIAHMIKVDEFYVFDKEGQIHWVNGSKKKLLALMANQAGKIEAFIESKNLNLNNKAHLRAIFHYYNTLLRTEEKKDPEPAELLTYFSDAP
jgi:hypothetical protein